MSHQNAGKVLCGVALAAGLGFWAGGAVAQSRPTFTPPVLPPPPPPRTQPKGSQTTTAANPNPNSLRSGPPARVQGNPALEKAIASKDYAFLLKYYGDRCETRPAGSFKDAEEFDAFGRGAGNCYFLGELYRNGQGVAADVNVALKNYQIAADGGYWPAVVDLATMRFRGDGVAQDVAGGVSLLSRYITDPRNAPRGICRGADFLADLYVKGRYVTQSGAEADKWYQYCLDKAIDPKAPLLASFAIHTLVLQADLYNNEQLMPGQAERAAKIYDRVVTIGDHDHAREDTQSARRALGQMYIAGRGVAKDVDKGIGLLKAAVSQTVTDPQSAVILYRLYTADEVVPADPAQAASYLDIAIKANWPEAQTIAARNALAANPPQPDKAKALLQAAVVTGYAPAQYELGNYYLKYGAAGSGPVTAYLWFDLAAQNGDAEAAKARDALAGKLSADDLNQVRTAQAQLKAKYPNIVAN